jgi:hypothetical protein
VPEEPECSTSGDVAAPSEESSSEVTGDAGGEVGAAVASTTAETKPFSGSYEDMIAERRSQW